MALYSKSKADAKDGKLNPADLGAISKELERLEARQRELDDREAKVASHEGQQDALGQSVRHLTAKNRELEATLAEYTDVTRFQPKLPGDKENEARQARVSAPGSKCQALAQDAAADMAAEQLRRRVRQLEAQLTELKKKLAAEEAATASERRRALELLERAEAAEALRRRAAEAEARAVNAETRAKEADSHAAMATAGGAERAAAALAELEQRTNALQGQLTAAAAAATAAAAAAKEDTDNAVTAVKRTADAELVASREELKKAIEGSRVIDGQREEALTALAIRDGEIARLTSEVRELKDSSDAEDSVRLSVAAKLEALQTRNVENEAAAAAAALSASSKVAATKESAAAALASLATAKAESERMLSDCATARAAAEKEAQRFKEQLTAAVETGETIKRQKQALAIEVETLSRLVGMESDAREDATRAAAARCEALMADARAAFAAATVDVRCLRAEVEDMRRELGGLASVRTLNSTSKNAKP
jgi:hypothetical protein